MTIFVIKQYLKSEKVSEEHGVFRALKIRDLVFGLWCWFIASFRMNQNLRA